MLLHESSHKFTRCWRICFYHQVRHRLSSCPWLRWLACRPRRKPTSWRGQTYGVWQKNHGKTRGFNHGNTRGKTTSQLCSLRSVLVMKVAPAWSISDGAIHTSNGTNSWDLTNPQQPVHATITCIDVDRRTTWLPDLGMIWYDIAMNWCQYHVLVATPINKHHRLVSFVPPYTILHI